MKLLGLTLTGEPVAASVVVEVDMPGDEEPVRSKTVPLKKGGKAGPLGFDQAYDAGPTSSLLGALVDAMETAEKADSEVHFIVLGMGKSEAELGVAKLSLEDILEKGKDLTGASLPIRAGGGSGEQVGELSLSVSALAAMRAVKKAADGEPDEAAATPREAAKPASATPQKKSSGPPPEPDTLGVYISGLSLHAAALGPKPKVPPIRATVTVLGLEPQASPPLKVDRELKAASSFYAHFGCDAKSRLRKAMAAQLPGLDPEDPVVSIELAEEGKKGRETKGEWARAELLLPRLLALPGDAAEVEVDMLRGDDVVGLLTLSLNGLALLRQLAGRPEPDAGATAAPGEPTRRRRSAQPAAEASISVRVSSAKLNGAGAKLVPAAASLVVEVDLPGEDEPLKSTPAQARRGSTHARLGQGSAPSPDRAPALTAHQLPLAALPPPRR